MFLYTATSAAGLVYSSYRRISRSTKSVLFEMSAALCKDLCENGHRNVRAATLSCRPCPSVCYTLSLSQHTTGGTASLYAQFGQNSAYKSNYLHRLSYGTRPDYVSSEMDYTSDVRPPTLECPFLHESLYNPKECK